MIESIISYIKKNDVQPQVNILYRFTLKELLFGALTASATILGAGYSIGTLVSSQSKDTIQIKYEQSVSLLNHLTDSIANEKANKATRKNGTQ